MAKSENQKLKTLYIARFFLENSDENHAVTAGDIVDYLEMECGITAERHSIYRDIAALRDVFGMDIEGGQGGGYRLRSRRFDFDDLRILAECVHAAKFISARKAKEMVETISEMGSAYQGDLLRKEVFLCDRVKTTQKGTLNIVSTIQQAMAKQCDGKPHEPEKISFKYLRYSINDLNTQVERHKGARYKVSPFCLLINDGYYYLLAFDDGVQDIRTYRVDRMKDVRLLGTPREGDKAFEAIDIKSYTRRVFSMFGGEKRRVSIRFEKRLLDTAVERFGTTADVFYRPEGETDFVVSTDVEVSDLFYAWVCGFRSRAKIIAPPDVVEGMKAYIQSIAEMYE